LKVILILRSLVIPTKEESERLHHSFRPIFWDAFPHYCRTSCAPAWQDSGTSTFHYEI